MLGHRRGGKGLLHQPGHAIADIRQRRADRGRSDRDIVHHPHRATITILDGHRDRGPEGQQIDQQRDEEAPDLQGLLDQALEQPDDHTDRQSDGDQLAKVTSPGQRGHRIEDLGQESGIADGVDLEHGVAL